MRGADDFIRWFLVERAPRIPNWDTDTILRAFCTDRDAEWSERLRLAEEARDQVVSLCAQTERERDAAVGRLADAEEERDRLRADLTKALEAYDREATGRRDEVNAAHAELGRLRVRLRSQEEVAKDIDRARRDAFIAGRDAAVAVAQEMEACWICGGELTPADRPYCQDEHALEDREGEPEPQHISDAIAAIKPPETT